MRGIIGRTLVATVLIAGMAMAEVEITKIVGPETPGGDYKHPASITELSNGDLYLAWYGGMGEYEGDTKVHAMRLRQGEVHWQGPEVIADTPNRGDGNPVVWQEPDGPLWLFYVVRYGDTWSQSRIKGKISKDAGQTWSDSFQVAWEMGMMVRCKPLCLGKGDFLLPIYNETGSDREVVGADTTSLFLRYDAKENTFTETNRIFSRIGNLQPSVIALSKKHFVCYSRRAGGYEPMTDGWMVTSESKDGGQTWSEGVEMDFPNPNSAVDALMLQSGNVFLTYNDNMNDRTPLSVAISKDKGKTWPIKKNLLDGPGPYAYPYAIQTKDGKIHIIYTTNRRTTIMHAVMDEADLLK
jgi:predicted neuraminidase